MWKGYFSTSNAMSSALRDTLVQWMNQARYGKKLVLIETLWNFVNDAQNKAV